MGSSGEIPGIGWDSLALTFGALGLVCVLAWVTLRLLARRLGGEAVTGPLGGALRIVARCPLEPRRSVYIVEALGRCFLVGVGDGPMALLAELDAAALPPRASVPALRFADVLGRVLGRGAGSSRAPAATPAIVPAAPAKLPGPDAGAAP